MASLAFGGMVAASTWSSWATLVLAVVASAAARRLSVRVTAGVLGVLVVLGVPWIVAPFIAGLVWLGTEHRRGSLAWMRANAVRMGVSGAFASVCAGIAAAVVAAPFVRAQLEAAPLVFDTVRPTPVVVVAAIAVFACANAIGEELLWRGALLADGRPLPPGLLYPLQAASFGLAHWHGLPGGVIGVPLTAVAGAVFLWLDRRYGIAASVTAHVLADAGIFAAALPLVLFTGWSA